MFKKAYLQLTLWYLAIVMTISIMFSFALYNVASGELSDSLRRESARISNQYPFFQNQGLIQPKKDLGYGNHVLIVRLLTFNLIVLISAGFASYLLARKTLRPIEESHHQQKLFTANVSHELRTPLTALKMEDEVVLMNENASKSDLKQTIKSNLEEVTKIENLINNILKLTKLENDELKSEFTNVSLTDTIKDSVDQVISIASSRNIGIESEVPRDINVFGNKSALVQLIIILLDNSIKYSKENTIIVVSIKQLDKKQAQIIIKDQGIGINPDNLKHIFDRFYQADQSRSSELGGYGLGLSIAKSIVDIHNGTIIISSRIDNGTTVKVNLPLV